MAQLRPMQRDDYRRRTLPTAKALKEKCDELRWIVEHPNQDGKIMLKTGVIVDRDPKQVMTFHLDGLEIGYRVFESSPLEINPFFQRDVFFKIPGYRISDLSKEERTTYLTTLFEAFLEPQQGMPDIEPISDDCVKMSQQFQVAFYRRIQNARIQVPRGIQ